MFESLGNFEAQNLDNRGVVSPAETRSREKRSRFARLGAIGLTVLLAIAPLGCRGKPSSRPPQPVVSNTASSQADLALDEADAHFEAGRYSQAAAAYDSTLSSHPTSESPQVLFRQALSHLLGSLNRGHSQAMPILRKLATDDPGSSLGAASKVILSLLEDAESLSRKNEASEKKVKQLSEELEKLKKIDMRRRPPKP